MSLIWQPPSAPAPAPTQPSPFRLAGPLLSRRPPFVAGSPLSPLSRDELGRAAYILRLEVPTVPPSPLMRLREIARRLAPAYFTIRDATDVATEDGNRLYIKYTAHVRLESPFGDPNVAVSADSRENAPRRSPLGTRHFPSCFLSSRTNPPSLQRSAHRPRLR